VKAPPELVKITGARGDWTALVGPDRLAVIHNIWWTPPGRYLDPMHGANLTGKRYNDFVDALQTHDRTVMQKTAADGSFARLGYIGVFTFDSLAVAADGAVSLRITARLPFRPVN